MEYLTFIFYLGFMYITFDVIWGLFRFLLKITLDINYEERLTFHIFKSFSYFVLVTLSAVITIQYLQGSEQLAERLLYYFLGFAVLYFYITSRMHRSRLKAVVRMKKRMLQRMRYNSIYLFASLIFFLVCINIPALVQNELTLWFYQLVIDVYNMGFFRFIIGFFAVLFLLNVLYHGFLATKQLVENLFGIRPSTSRIYEEKYGKSDELSDGEYIDYEEVDEDK